MKYIYIICELLICAHSLVYSAAKAPQPAPTMGQLTAPSEQDQLLAAQNAFLRKQIAHVVAQQSVSAKKKQDDHALAVAKKVVAAQALQSTHETPAQNLAALDQDSCDAQRAAASVTAITQKQPTSVDVAGEFDACDLEFIDRVVKESRQNALRKQRAQVVAKEIDAHAAVVAQGRPLEKLLRLPREWEDLRLDSQSAWKELESYEGTAYSRWVDPELIAKIDHSELVVLVSEEEIVRLHEYYCQEWSKINYTYDECAIYPMSQQPKDYLEYSVWNKLSKVWHYAVKGYKRYPDHPHTKHSAKLYLGPVGLNKKRSLEESRCAYCDDSKPTLPIGYIEPSE